MEVRIRNFPDFRERLPKVRFSFFKRVCFWKSNPTKRVNFRIFIRILPLFKGERIRLCQSNLTPIKSKYSFYKHELFVQLVSYLCCRPALSWLCLLHEFLYSRFHVVNSLQFLGRDTKRLHQLIHLRKIVDIVDVFYFATSHPWCLRNWLKLITSLSVPKVKNA